MRAFSVHMREMGNWSLKLEGKITHGTCGWKDDLSAWSWALIEMPPVAQPLRNFTECYRTVRFIMCSHRLWPLLQPVCRVRPGCSSFIADCCCHQTSWESKEGFDWTPVSATAVAFDIDEWAKGGNDRAMCDQLGAYRASLGKEMDDLDATNIVSRTNDI
jgi:hypothetical protein